MDIRNIKSALIIMGFTALFAVAIYFCGFAVCRSISDVNAETMVVNINGSDIIYESDDFYIETPTGDKIPLGISEGEVLDLTKHSEVLVKFKRYPAWGLYGGSGWFVDGVVKKP